MKNRLLKPKWHDTLMWIRRRKKNRLRYMFYFKKYFVLIDDKPIDSESSKRKAVSVWSDLLRMSYNRWMVKLLSIAVFELIVCALVARDNTDSIFRCFGWKGKHKQQTWFIVNLLTRLASGIFDESDKQWQTLIIKLCTEVATVCLATAAARWYFVQFVISQLCGV